MDERMAAPGVERGVERVEVSVVERVSEETPGSVAEETPERVPGRAPGAPGAGAEPADGSWRERAERAEAMAAEVAGRLAGLHGAAEDLRRMLAASEHERRVDAALFGHGVRDLARAREEVRVFEGEGLGVEEAVMRLRERRPGLFRAGLGAGLGQGVSRGERSHAVPEGDFEGDRASVLRYMRALRGA